MNDFTLNNTIPGLNEDQGGSGGLMAAEELMRGVVDVWEVFLDVDVFLMSFIHDSFYRLGTLKS